MRRLTAILPLLCLFTILCLPVTPLQAADPLPEWLQKAQTTVAQAALAADAAPELADDILIAQNTLRNAEADYRKNLGWTGKLDQKAEPAIRHLAELARLQASVVLATSSQRTHERTTKQLEQRITETRARIKVFDDLNTQIRSQRKQMADQESRISGLKSQVASLTAELAAKGSAITSSDQKTNDLLKALDEQKKATASSQQQLASLTQELDNLKKETATLKAAGQKLTETNHQQSFELELYRLGGTVKSGDNAQSVTFSRSRLLKVSGKSTVLTPEGNTTVARLAELLKTYPEYRIKLRVHGFGQPARSEDAAATDQMARFVREALLSKGGFEPAAVEALGVGAAEPVFPKKEVEGNRRIEINFVKK